MLSFGSMGWAYEDWKGPFYSREIAQEKMLTELSRVFDAVEIDASFYGAPRESTLQRWNSQTPPGFRFSAKAPRAITHEKRLVRASEDAAFFSNLCRETLGEKLGAILLQLPPDFSADERRNLERFLDDADPLAPWAVEFRNASWADTDIVDSLAARQITIVTTEKLDLGAPLRYVRLLGDEGSVERFDARQIDRRADLDAWAERLAQVPDETPALVFVRNFFEGHAPESIAYLRKKLGLGHPTPPGKQQMSLF